MPTPDDAELEACLLRLCRARGPGRSICPSEAARALDADEWRALMPAIRAAAARLVARGELRATRAGREIHPEAPGGPIRLWWRA